MEQIIYLSRRNLEILLSKLDRKAAGEQTECAIIKHRQPGLGVQYNQTMISCKVVAVPDEEFYGAQERGAGQMHPKDEANISSFHGAEKC